MIPSVRHQKIIELLSVTEFISIQDLAEHFNVSVETIRRDIGILDKKGKIQKVYGGIKLNNVPFGEPSIEIRFNSNIAQKDLIANKCCELVSDGDCIFIDSGTTTFYMAKYLKGKKNISVITNSILVVNELMDSDIEVIMIGGRVRHEERSVVSVNYLFNFSQLNVQKCFIGAGGISLENGVSDYDMYEAETRRQIIARSKVVIVVADSSKIGMDAMIHIVPLDKVDYIVTNQLADSKFANEIVKKDVNLIIAG